MLERQLPWVAGRNENVTVALCASPTLSRSDVVRDKSNVVKTPPTQVTEADGVNVLSIILFTATLPSGPPTATNVGCSLIDSARRYPTRPFTFVRSRPTSCRGENDQVIDPLGHSRVRLRIGTCSSARKVQMIPRVKR